MEKAFLIASQEKIALVEVINLRPLPHTQLASCLEDTVSRNITTEIFDLIESFLKETLNTSIIKPPHTQKTTVNGGNLILADDNLIERTIANLCEITGFSEGIQKNLSTYCSKIENTSENNHLYLADLCTAPKDVYITVDLTYKVDIIKLAVFFKNNHMGLPKTTISLEGLTDIEVEANTSDGKEDRKTISILLDMDEIKAKIQQKATEIGYSMKLTTKMITLKFIFEDSETEPNRECQNFFLTKILAITSKEKANQPAQVQTRIEGRRRRQNVLRHNQHKTRRKQKIRKNIVTTKPTTTTTQSPTTQNPETETIQWEELFPTATAIFARETTIQPETTKTMLSLEKRLELETLNRQRRNVLNLVNLGSNVLNWRHTNNLFEREQKTAKLQSNLSRELEKHVKHIEINSQKGLERLQSEMDIICDSNTRLTANAIITRYSSELNRIGLLLLETQTDTGRNSIIHEQAETVCKNKNPKYTETCKILCSSPEFYKHIGFKAEYNNDLTLSIKSYFSTEIPVLTTLGTPHFVRSVPVPLLQENDIFFYEVSETPQLIGINDPAAVSLDKCTTRGTLCLCKHTDLTNTRLNGCARNLIQGSNANCETTIYSTTLPCLVNYDPSLTLVGSFTTPRVTVDKMDSFMGTNVPKLKNSNDTVVAYLPMEKSYTIACGTNILQMPPKEVNVTEKTFYVEKTSTLDVEKSYIAENFAISQKLKNMAKSSKETQYFNSSRLTKLQSELDKTLAQTTSNLWNDLGYQYKLALICTATIATLILTTCIIVKIRRGIKNLRTCCWITRTRYEDPTPAPRPSLNF